MGCSIATVQHQPVSGLQEGASMLTTVACQLKLLTVAKLSMREICSTAIKLYITSLQARACKSDIHGTFTNSCPAWPAAGHLQGRLINTLM